MNHLVSFNLRILPVEKSFISAVSSAALYGKSVFTSLAIYHGNPFLWEKHWRRLAENAEKLDVNLSGFDEETVKTALLQLIFQNKPDTARARLTFLDGSSGKLWNFAAPDKTNLLITTAALRQPKDELLLTISPFPVNSRSPLAGVKSGNYLENLLALEEARKRGFDEVVRLNEKDEIVSASMANIFWIKNEKIFTPALETGCLAGTTRAFLLENFAVSETVSGLREIAGADEIFLTSAGIGIRPARFENGKKKKSRIILKLNELLDLHRVKA